MDALRWSLLLVLLSCAVARADDGLKVCAAIPIVERHVNAWHAQNRAPDDKDDSGYRALYKDLRDAGFIGPEAKYGPGSFGRTGAFFDPASNPALSVATLADDPTRIEFAIAYTGPDAKVVGVRRISTVPPYATQPVDAPCLGDNYSFSNAGTDCGAPSLLGVASGTASAPHATTSRPQSWCRRVLSRIER